MPRPSSSHFLIFRFIPRKFLVILPAHIAHSSKNPLHILQRPFFWVMYTSPIHRPYIAQALH